MPVISFALGAVMISWIAVLGSIWGPVKLAPYARGQVLSHLKHPPKRITSPPIFIRKNQEEPGQLAPGLFSAEKVLELYLKEYKEA